jgi:hypothetical protein
MIKKSKISYESRNQGFLLLFCLLMEGSGSGSVQIMTDPGQKHTDPDPQHCFTDVVSGTVNDTSLFRTDPRDVARTESRTFISTKV